MLDGGDAAGVLLGLATALNAAAVVMATRAARAVGRVVHGSVADRVMREGGRPVVLVPPRADYLRGRQVRLRRGLVPLDGSDAAIAALAHLLAFPHAEELDLVLLEVVLPDLRRTASGHAERRLDALAAQVRGRRATAETRVVEARARVLSERDVHAHNSFASPRAVEPRDEPVVRARGDGPLVYRFAPASVTRLSVTLA